MIDHTHAVQNIQGKVLHGVRTIINGQSIDALHCKGRTSFAVHVTNDGLNWTRSTAIAEVADSTVWNSHGQHDDVGYAKRGNSGGSLDHNIVFFNLFARCTNGCDSRTTEFEAISYLLVQTRLLIRIHRLATATMHSVTDGRTDGQHYDANSRSCCVQYDRQKRLSDYQCHRH